MTKIADRYEIIGSPLDGGMASVFPCKDTTLNRQVAIKVMPGSADKRRILDEVGALLKMRSKHVVQVYDVLRTENNDLSIVQEFVDGKDLFDKSLAPTTEAEYLKLVWQISSGISDIHRLNVIHRDIKPNNMKMDPEGVVKIFDFGLARNEGINASTVGFVGTPCFAAPELYVRNAKFTAAVDTYAFGATALFLGLRDLPAELKQEPPVFSGDNYFSKLPFKVSDEVSVMLSSCLHADPSSRPLMSNVRDTLSKHLLRDRHKALVVFNGKASYLNAGCRSVSLSLPSIGEIEIRYNGFSFCITRVCGEVFVNNNQVKVGDKLPGACVVALGSSAQMNKRKYITFDLSHPEIVL